MTRWASRQHVNALAAHLAYRCGVPVNDAGRRAVELIGLAELWASRSRLEGRS